MKKRIITKVNAISKDPTRYKRLHYLLTGNCRIRIDKLRIIFNYDEELKEIYLKNIVFSHRY